MLGHVLWCAEASQRYALGDSELPGRVRVAS